MMQHITLYELTGSAKMTTCTVALPGVSKLSSGVRSVCSASFIECSISGSYGQNNYYNVNLRVGNVL